MAFRTVPAGWKRWFVRLNVLFASVLAVPLLAAVLAWIAEISKNSSWLPFHGFFVLNMLLFFAVVYNAVLAYSACLTGCVFAVGLASVSGIPGNVKWVVCGAELTLCIALFALVYILRLDPFWRNGFIYG